MSKPKLKLIWIPKILFLSLWLFIFSNRIYAQTEDLSQVWPTKWIQAKTGPTKEFAVFHFRKTFSLDAIPEKLLVHTSGDMRYQFFVNGQKVTWGPLTGDLRHWYYETTNISPYLKPGKNTLSAVVLNYGSHPPDARLTVQTGFLLAADDQKFRFLNTNESWKAIHNQAYSPFMVDKSQINGYYGGGSREIINGNQFVWNWEKPDFNDSLWENAVVIEQAYARSCRWAGRWKLMPRALPLEKLETQRIPLVRITEGFSAPASFPLVKTKLSISAHSKVRLVLDNKVETTAYPVFEMSEGKNARILIRYSEAALPKDAKTTAKGNRNDLTNKSFYGYCDKIITDGGMARTYSPLWWRAFRYLEIEIETMDEKLVIEDVYTVQSTYPFQTKSAFKLAGHPDKDFSKLIDSIFSIGIRTSQLCAHETFVDCPYYEESQFEGDTRVEALISYFNFGDPSLGRNAIEQFSWSINDEGFLSARYPTNSLYYIPNFSLYWIGMLHDYHQYVGDAEFLKSKMAITRSILDYFFRHQRADGSLAKTDYHTFSDWVFANGEAPSVSKAQSAVADLHLLMALQWAAELEKSLGDKAIAQSYQTKIELLSKTIRNLYWNAERQLYSDTPEGKFYSQHTNSLAVITGLSTGAEAKATMKKVVDRENMTVATLYFQFYVAEAMNKAGLGDLYTDNLQTWKEVLDLGVTTWPETGANSRSECHGWGASPNYHFFKVVCGIESLEPGFRKLRIAPNFGKSTSIQATMPLLEGTLQMKLEKTSKGGLIGEVSIPGGIQSTLVWKGIERSLSPGKQTIKL